MVYILLFLIGLAVGSFLNVVIYRLHTGKSFLFNRSHCPKCKKILAWYDLIPLVSFALTKGKCRYCGERISWQYPLVEFFTGLLFVSVGYLVFEKFSCEQLLYCYIVILLYCFFISCLIVIFVYDLKHFIIPDQIVYPAIVGALLFKIIPITRTKVLYNLGGGGIAAGLAAGFFLILILTSRGKWMGWGDVKMALFMGLLLGWPNILVALMLAFVTGGIIGLGLILTKKKVFKSQLPFGPFLSAATLISIFWGDKLVNWYLNFIGY